MNIVIDVGNTLIKFGVFNSQKLIFKDKGTLTNYLSKIEEIVVLFPNISNAVLSIVGNFPTEYIAVTKRYFKIFYISKDILFPIKIAYKTPDTLGIDRMVLAASAYFQYSSKNILVIDTGTCITYDFVDDKGIYQGGAISPGIQLRYQSLNEYTHKLPLLEMEFPDYFIGKSTKSSIHSGVINGVIYEIDGVINQYDKKFKDLTVILTGGSADFLRDKLKNSIFANSNFLLEGLNFLFEYNKV